MELGADLRVKLAEQLGVALTEKNEIAVDKSMRTSVHGVYAAGDVAGCLGRAQADHHRVRTGLPGRDGSIRVRLASGGCGRTRLAALILRVSCGSREQGWR